MPLFLISMVLTTTVMAPPLNGGESPQTSPMDQERILAGAVLFPSFLAADLNIANKRGTDGALMIMLVHAEKKSTAETLAWHLKKTKKIRGIPIRVELMTERSLDAYAGPLPAAIFLVDRLSRDLESVIHYGNEHHVLVFSPLEGDVERGVMGGIFISDKVHPYINLEALRSAKLHLKHFFLRVARRYD